MRQTCSITHLDGEVTALLPGPGGRRPNHFHSLKNMSIMTSLIALDDVPASLATRGKKHKSSPRTGLKCVRTV